MTQNKNPKQNKNVKPKPWWFRWTRRLLVFLVITSMTLILLSQILGRALSPMLNKYKNHVEQELGSVLNSSVTIENIDTRWDFMVPYLEISGVNIQPEKMPSDVTDDKPFAQHVGNISVGVNLIEMAKARSFFPNSLRVKNLSVFVLKNKAGEFSLPGFNVPKRNENVEFEKYLNAIRHKLIQVSNAKLSILNETTDTILTIKPIEFDFLSSKDRNQGLLTWIPNDGKNQKATVRFDLAGDVREPQNWAGDVNVYVPPLSMALLKPYLPDNLSIESGHAGIQFDVALDKMLVKESTGELDLLVNFDEAQTLKWKTPLSIINQSTRYNLRAQNPMTLGDTAIDVLKDAGVEVDFDEKFHFGIYGNGLDLSALPGLLKITSAVPDEVSNHLEQSKLQGQANRLFLGWDDVLGWGASTQVSGLSMQAYKGIPGILSEKGVSAQADYFNEELLLNLDKQAFTFTYPKLFDQPFKIHELTTVLILSRKPDIGIETLDFALDMEDIDLTGDVSVRFPKDQPPYLKIKAQGGEGKFSSIPKFVPKTIGPKTLGWFKQAFRKGQLMDVSIDIDGPVDQLIDNNSSAVMRVKAKSKNSTFSFLKKWPEVHSADFEFELDRGQFHVTSEKAKTANVSAKKVYASIADLNKLGLKVSVETDKKQKLADLFQYADNSPLKKALKPVLNNFDASGQTGLTFDLDINLSEKHAEDTDPHVFGTLDFSGAKLHMPAMKMNVSDLYGQLAFTENSIDAKKIRGHLNGAPLSLHALTRTTKQGKRAYIHMDTVLSPSELLKDKVAFITNKLSGKPKWHAILDFGLDKGSDAPKLNVMSNLKELKIDLPQPLKKEPGVTQLFQWLMTLDETSSAYMNLNHELEGAFLFDRNYALETSQINYQRGMAVLPDEKGVFIDVASEELSLTPWIDYIAEVSENQASITQQSSPEIKKVNVFGRKVFWGGYTLDHVISELLPMSDGWQIDVLSKPVSGRALYNTKTNSVDAHIRSLDINALVANTNEKGSNDPGAIPNLNVNIDKVVVGKKQLNNLSFTSAQSNQGLTLNRFVLNDTNLTLSGSGKWFNDAQGKPKSEITFNWPSNDLSKDLDFLELNELLSGTESLITGVLHWEGSLFSPHALSLAGNVNVNANNGTIVAVKPGVAKLLGLLNAKSLPKRLLFNFKDFSAKGLSFDSVTSSIDLNQGIATINDFKMKTDVGEIYLNGRVDIPNKRINQVAIVNPELSSMLAITGGAVGGLPGFLGGVVLERLIKVFGGNTDEVAQIRYAIKGPWDDPKVTSTDVKRIKDLTMQEMRERVEKIRQREAQKKLKKSALKKQKPEPVE